MCSHGGGRSPLVPSSTQQKMPDSSVWVLAPALTLALVLALVLALPSTGEQHLEEAERIMSTTPVIDGHNDLPWQLLWKFNNQLRLPAANLTLLNDTHTNIPKLRQGHVGGQMVVEEMNRLGMMVDLAHVSVDTMKVVLNISKAPVIFSHSSAYSLCQHRRNVPDDVLQLVASTGSLVMVNFYNAYVTCSDKATLSDVADHMDHVKKVAGAQAVGFGGDYDGVPGVPAGLEDVSKYPALVAELLARNWTEREVKGALAENLLRVFSRVEEVKRSLQGTAAHETPIAFEELQGPCRTRYGYPNGAGTARRPPAALALPLALALLLSVLS
ncbi:Dipeptidase 1 [Lonchura striata]|uniref:Dipeptidase n=1 Tax=Lonchura striata TaxID=40157 RepID=A0A218USJ6_9PASE|nr:dipeptidase 1 [Lonchura striata domestica]OWK56743.1 Dipeptidase 1 [Lonchura striata domestica]